MTQQQKAWRVVQSCQTLAQARVALRYLELLSLRETDADVMKLRCELVTLWGLE